VLESEFDLDLTNKGVSEFIGHIERRTFFDRSDFNPSLVWLACKNCMINLGTLETRRFSHEYLATVQIPVEYVEENNHFVQNHCIGAIGELGSFWIWVQDPLLGLCPTFMKFLYEIMAPQDIEYILDFLSYCLWRDYQFQIFVILNGKGNNGKSTLLAFIKNFLGHKNVSGESLYRLSDPHNKFVTAQLYGKLANIDADISKIKLEDTGTLKKLTGRDEIFGENKFKTPFTFVNYAKLIFSTNDIPQTPDESDAYFRRLKIIDFKKQFFGKEVDLHLLEKLKTSREKSGVLTLILRRLPWILSEGIAETTDESIVTSYQKYVTSSDPIRAFYEDAIEAGHYAGYKVLKEELYQAYIQFCINQVVTPQSKGSFNRVWSKEPYSYESKKGSGRGDRSPYWMGMKLKPDYVSVSAEQGQSTIFCEDGDREES
jgi:putative DNA primase/helicase